MFAEFSETNFPIVNCIFSRTVENNSDFSASYKNGLIYIMMKKILYLFSIQHLLKIPLKIFFLKWRRLLKKN